MREAVVETHLYQRTEALGGLCIKLNPLWYFGIPDRMLLLPGGRVIFVETKQPKGTHRPKQPWWRTKLLALGFEHYTLWSVDQVDAFFDSLA